VKAFALLLLAGAALADGVDPVAAHEAHRRGLAKVAREETEYWRGFADRWILARDAWDKGAAGSLRSLHVRYAALARERARVDGLFARSGSPEAFELLLAELLETSKLIEDLEYVLLAPANPAHLKLTGQTRAIRRHALQFRLDGLVRALAQVPDAVPRLDKEGWHAAERADKERTTLRRVAILDALALTKSKAAHALLLPHLRVGAARPLRIAALEGLALQGRPAIRDLAPLLTDQDPVVVRALLQTIRSRPVLHPDWMVPVVRAVPALGGQNRVECQITLRKLLENAGDLDQLAEQVGRVEHGALLNLLGHEPRTIDPFDVRSESRAVLFLLDLARRMPGVEAELMKGVRGMPLGATFAVDLLGGDAASYFGPFDATATPLHGVRSFLDEHRRAGRAAPLRGLLRAPDDGIDTVYLVSDGTAPGGPFLLPDAALAAFSRANRFQRVVVHTVAAGASPSQRRFLEALAESTGGRFVTVAPR
jgi:hypothetical protein